jgi:PHD/YefM family antitoxin component YafN of YafNO toxin-antitoxin module
MSWCSRIVRNGPPRIASVAGRSALEDTLELLSDPSAMAEMKVARDEVAQGKTIGIDELRAKYLSR